jgi:hypothetical protein
MSVSAERSTVLQYRSPAASAVIAEGQPARPTFPAVSDPGAAALAAQLASIQGGIDALVQSTIEQPTPEYFRIPPLYTRRVRARVRNRAEGTIRLVLDEP